MLQKATFLAAWLMASSALAGDLTVTFSGVRSDRGKLSAALFRETDNWPDGKGFREVDIQPKAGDVTYVFKDIPPGHYAISAFHDENGNGVFDTNFVGMPKEGFCFSNDAKPGLASPSFKAASFEVGPGPATATIHVEYWSSSR